MFCTNCGTVVDDKALFCMNCGAQLQPKEEPAVETVAAVEAAPVAETASVVESVPENAVREEPVVDTGAETQSVPAETPVYETPAEASAPVVPVEPVFAPKPVATYTAPMAAPVVPAAPPLDTPAAPAEKPTSVWMYLLMILLNGLPVVGLIAHIIALAVAKKKSFKNYCCAMVILGIIGLLLAIAGVVVGYVFLDELNELLAEFNIMIEPLF